MGQLDFFMFLQVEEYLRILRLFARAQKEAARVPTRSRKPKVCYNSVKTVSAFADCYKRTHFLFILLIAFIYPTTQILEKSPLNTTVRYEVYTVFDGKRLESKKQQYVLAWKQPTRTVLGLLFKKKYHFTLLVIICHAFVQERSLWIGERSALSKLYVHFGDLYRFYLLFREKQIS